MHNFGSYYGFCGFVLVPTRMKLVEVIVSCLIPEKIEQQLKYF